MVAAAVSEEAEITSPKKKSKKGKIIAVIVAVVVVILALVIGFVAYNNVQEKTARAEYIDNFKAAGNTMLQGAADAETVSEETEPADFTDMGDGLDDLDDIDGLGDSLNDGLGGFDDSMF